MQQINHQFVVFDLYGTLIKFGVMHHPFRALLKLARENGRKVASNDARTLMTVNADLPGMAYHLGISPPSEFIRELEAQIRDELSSLTLFDDVIPTLDAIRSHGIEIGVCSNLAQPYGAAIDILLVDTNLERFLSYEVGTIKPEARIYESILSRFKCKAEQCLFIGDTFEVDYSGPTAMGMKALHLARHGATQPYQITSLDEVSAYLGVRIHEQFKSFV